MCRRRHQGPNWDLLPERDDPFYMEVFEALFNHMLAIMQECELDDASSQIISDAAQRRWDREYDALVDRCALEIMNDIDQGILDELMRMTGEQ
jgi:hypothetical protein